MFSVCVWAFFVVVIFSLFLLRQPRLSRLKSPWMATRESDCSCSSLLIWLAKPSPTSAPGGTQTQDRIKGALPWWLKWLQVWKEKGQFKGEGKQRDINTLSCWGRKRGFLRLLFCFRGTICTTCKCRGKNRSGPSPFQSLQKPRQSLYTVFSTSMYYFLVLDCCCCFWETHELFIEVSVNVCHGGKKMNIFPWGRIKWR